MRTLILDTETDALVRNSLLPLEQQPRIIEFYGLVLDENLEKVDELEFMCNPGAPLPDEVVRITRITDEMLKDKEPFKAHAKSVKDLIDRSRSVVSHNLSFDFFVIDAELRRAGYVAHWPTMRICTVENTEHLFGYRLKLSDLYEKLFGEKVPEAHRARHDVEALHRCFVELKKRGDL